MSALSDIAAKLDTDVTAALAARDAQIASLTAENAALKADAADVPAVIASLTATDAKVAPAA